MQSGGKAVFQIGRRIKNKRGLTLSNKKQVFRRWRDHFVNSSNPLSDNALDNGGDPVNGGADESFDNT